MSRKILVIEDEKAILSLICTSLEATGYEVDSFLDGDEASAEALSGIPGKFQTHESHSCPLPNCGLSDIVKTMYLEEKGGNAHEDRIHRLLSGRVARQ